MYVGDNCRALDLILRHGDIGDIYNVGTNMEKTNIEVTEAILNAVGASEELIDFIDDRTGHEQRYALKTRKLELLDRKPPYSFHEGPERWTTTSADK